MLRRILYILPILSLLIFLSCRGTRCNKSNTHPLTIAATTSFVDTGLADKLLPSFEKKYLCRVKLIAVGTGQAIRLARDGNADILLTHDKELEEKFISDGYGIKRIEVMRNDFIIVGPADDPAGIKNLPPLAALRKIATESATNKKVFFVSRGDNSGTHKKELYLWVKAGVTIPPTQYIETGNGMETTLRIADEKSAYTLTDKATFITHKKELTGLAPLVESDGKLLYNSYSLIAISPVKYPHANFPLAQKFIQYITQEEGREIIKNFGITSDGKGEPLFLMINHNNKERQNVQSN